MKFLSFITLAALLSPLYLPAMEMPNKKSQPKTQEPNQRVMNAQLMMMLIAQGKPHEALLVKAINSTNPKEAYEGFKELSEIDSDEKWHAMALMSKGQSLAKGEGVKQDRDAALKCYQDCYNKHKDPQALLCIGNHYEIAEALLKANVSPNEPSILMSSVVIQKQRDDSYPALAMIKLLLQYKADPNLTFDHTGLTVIHNAASLGYVDIINELIAAKADINVAGCLNNATPVKVAAAFNHLPAVKALLGIKSSSTENPLQYENISSSTSSFRIK